MTHRGLVRQIGREWLVAVLAYALLVAPFGCQWEAELGNLFPDVTDGTTAGDDKPTTGLFLNEGVTDGLVAGARNAQGDAFFIYGTRDDDGALAEVDSIVVRTADGDESFITFASGRPIHLEGADGSYVHLSYTLVTDDRVTADVVVYDATRDTTEETTVDIDLAQIRADLLAAANEAATTLANLTGQTVEVPVAPGSDTAKGRDRAGLLSSLVFVPLVLVGQFTMALMSKVMVSVFAAVTAAMQAAVIAAFAPLFLFTGMLGEVSVRVESLPLLDIFIELPDPPTISIEFD